MAQKYQIKPHVFEAMQYPTKDPMQAEKDQEEEARKVAAWALDKGAFDISNFSLSGMTVDHGVDVHVITSGQWLLYSELLGRFAVIPADQFATEYVVYDD